MMSASLPCSAGFARLSRLTAQYILNRDIRYQDLIISHEWWLMKAHGYQHAYDALARTLRMARQRADLTQAAVAERLGKPQSFVAKYESGERQLDLVEFLLVARALGVEPGRVIARLRPHIARERQASASPRTR